MPISREELDHLCRLAHIELSPEEGEAMRESVSSVLDHVARVQSVDTADVPGTAFAVPLDTITRTDEVRPSWSPAAVLANAPHRVDEYFEVQSIFE